MISQRKISEQFIINNIRYERVFTVNLENNTRKIKWYIFQKGKNAILDQTKIASLEQFYQQHIKPDVVRYFSFKIIVEYVKR